MLPPSTMMLMFSSDWKEPWINRKKNTRKSFKIPMDLHKSMLLRIPKATALAANLFGANQEPTKETVRWKCPTENEKKNIVENKKFRTNVEIKSIFQDLTLNANAWNQHLCQSIVLRYLLRWILSFYSLFISISIPWLFNMRERRFRLSHSHHNAYPYK